MPNIHEITQRVSQRMERENVGKIINNNTIDDGYGNFVTTVIYRSEPVVVSQGFVVPKRVSDTRYLIFVNGQAQSGGATEADWEDVDAGEALPANAFVEQGGDPDAAL